MLFVAIFLKRKLMSFLFFLLGADVNSLKRADWTPLMLACSKTSEDAGKCVQLLLKNNSNVSIRNKDGWTAFLVACRAGNPNIVRMLLSHAPEVIHTASNNGRSALHVAGKYGTCNSIQLT